MINSAQLFELELERANDGRLEANGLEILRINGQAIFPLYAMSSGVSSRTIMYISSKRIEHGLIRVLPIKLPLFMESIDAEVLAKRVITDAIERFQDLAQFVIADGGDFGTKGLDYTVRMNVQR